MTIFESLIFVVLFTSVNINVVFVSGHEIDQFADKQGLSEVWKSAKPIQGTQNIHCVQVLHGNKLEFKNLSTSALLHSTSTESVQESSDLLNETNDSEPAAYVNKVDLVPGSSYVAVIYDDVWWPGLVQSVTEDSAVISFMMPLKTENKFKWPKKSQIEIVKISEILAVIQCVPEPVNQRGTFCFPSDEADRLTKLMNKISD